MALGILLRVAWFSICYKSSKSWWNIKRYMSFRIYFLRSSIWVQLRCSNSSSLGAVIKWSQDVLFENVCRTEKMANKVRPNITSIYFTNWCLKDGCNNWGSGKLYQITRLMVKHALYFNTPLMDFSYLVALLISILLLLVSLLLS